MRKLRYKIGILFLLSVLLAGCDGWSWQRYYNKEHKFSILFPRSWAKEEGAMNTTVMAFAPLQRRDDKFRTNMNVVVTQLPRELDVATFFELNKDELTRRLASVEDLEEGDIYAGLMPGKILSFQGRMKELKLKIVSAVWIKDTRVYSVTCASEAKDFPQYEATFNKILRSLRVK